MSSYMKGAFGDLLVSESLNKCVMETLPSPEVPQQFYDLSKNTFQDLRYKILIKNKKLPSQQLQVNLCCQATNKLIHCQ